MTSRALYGKRRRNASKTRGIHAFFTRPCRAGKLRGRLRIRRKSAGSGAETAACGRIFTFARRSPRRERKKFENTPRFAGFSTVCAEIVRIFGGLPRRSKNRAFCRSRGGGGGVSPLRRRRTTDTISSLSLRKRRNGFALPKKRKGLVGNACPNTRKLN